MPLEITCKYCGKVFRVSDDVAGKHFRCVGCREVLLAPAPQRPTPPKPAPQKTTPQKLVPQKPATSPPSQTNRPSPAIPRSSQSRPPGRSQTTPPTSRSQQVSEPDPEDFYDDDEPFGYDGPMEASWNDMPGGPVGQPRRTPKAKPKPRRVISRNDHPEAFAEYDRIVNEIAIFWIGLAIIVGGFAVLMSTVFWDAAGDQTRLKTIIGWQAGIAASMFFIGLITFTKSKIWLFALFFICAVYLLASVILALTSGCLLYVLPAAFCLIYVRLGKALSAHP